MNYCLDFSIRVEDEMLRLIEELCTQKGCTQEELTIDEEQELYEKARDTMVERDGGKTWAAGNVRLGEIILIIDSDTRVVSSTSSRKMGVPTWVQELTVTARRLSPLWRSRNARESRSGPPPARLRHPASRQQRLRKRHYLLHQPNLHFHPIRSRQRRLCTFRRPQHLHPLESNPVHLLQGRRPNKILVRLSRV